jgi:hypothetical protein
MAEANQQIINSIYGLIIILASYLLLNTINPEMVILKGPQINSGNMGIVIYDNDGCGSGVGEYSFLHIYSNTVFGDTTICSGTDCDSDQKENKDYWINHVKSIRFKSAPEEMKVKYALKSNPEKLTEFSFQKNGCLSASFSDLKKITFEYNLPGVYLYKDDACEDDFLFYTMSTSGFPSAPVDWINKVKCLRIVNTKESRFVAVLHEHANYKGQCKEFVGKKDPDPNNPEIFKLSLENSNKLANTKNSFVQAKPLIIAEIDPTQLTDDNPAPDPTQVTDDNPAPDPTQVTDDNPAPDPTQVTDDNPAPDPTQVPGSLGTYSGLKEMADSLTIFEIPKQKRNNDGSDQGVFLYDRTNYDYSISQQGGIPAPSIFIQGSKSDQLKNNIYYYFFNTGISDINPNLGSDVIGSLKNLLSQNIPTVKLQKDSTFDGICNQACNGCCVGFKDLGKKSENAISSLKVSLNYTAILWEHSNYSGMCEVFNNNVADLNSYDMGKCFNWFGLGSSDCTSSLKVFQKK